MSEFDERWRELAKAARRSSGRSAAPSARRIAELAALASARSPARMPEPRHRRAELVSLLATAALLAVILGIALHDRAAWQSFTGATRAELAHLTDRVPRAPRFVSPSRALDVLPDLGALVRPLSTASETSP